MVTVCSIRKSFMFSDPQSITISGAAKSLPRVSSGDFTGEFRAADGSYVLSVKHTSNKRDRSMVRIDSRKIGANPLDPSRNLPFSAGAYVVLDAPANGTGYTSVELEDLVKALTAYLTAANITKFVGKES
jgi:hypothetical protein